MLIRKLHRQLLAGIVLFALLLQTVLPAIAGATSGPDARWVEICAASGVKWVKLDPASTAGQHADSDHCVLCMATGAVPEFDARVYLPQGLADAHCTSLSFSFIHCFPGHQTCSRAPPAQS